MGSFRGVSSIRKVLRTFYNLVIRSASYEADSTYLEVLTTQSLPHDVDNTHL